MTYPTCLQRRHIQDQRQDDDDRPLYPAEGLAVAGPTTPGLDEEQDGERDQDDPVDEREEAGFRLRRHPDRQLDGADHEGDPDRRKTESYHDFPGFPHIAPQPVYSSGRYHSGVPDSIRGSPDFERIGRPL